MQPHDHPAPTRFRWLRASGRVVKRLFTVLGGLVTLGMVGLYVLGMTLGRMSIGDVSQRLYRSSPQHVVNGLGEVFQMAKQRARPVLSPLDAPVPAATRDAGWKQDIDYLTETIDRVHVVAWRYTTVEEMRARAAKIVARIPERTDRQLACDVTALLAPLGDGHTRVNTSDTATPLRLLPIYPRVFPDGVFIVETTAEQTRLLGAEIVAIGQTPTPQAVPRTRGLLTAENRYAELANAEEVFANSDYLHAVGLAASPDAVTFELRLCDGKREAVTLKPTADMKARPTWAAKPEPQPAYRKDRQKVVWFDYRAETKSLVVKYNSCSERGEFLRVAGELLATVDANPVERIIVDLRGNGGGDSSIINPLLAGIEQRGYNRRGKLFVLTDRYTYSSGFHGLMELRKRNAIHLGEASGQKLNYGGNNTRFQLPFSQLSVSYPTQDSAWLPGIDIRSVEPDLPVATLSSDHFAGKDPVLDAAIGYRAE